MPSIQTSARGPSAVYAFSPIPEPGTALLMMLGLGLGLGGRAAQRRRIA